MKPMKLNGKESQKQFFYIKVLRSNDILVNGEEGWCNLMLF